MRGELQKSPLLSLRHFTLHVLSKVANLADNQFETIEYRHDKDYLSAFYAHNIWCIILSLI